MGTKVSERDTRLYVWESGKTAAHYFHQAVHIRYRHAQIVLVHGACCEKYPITAARALQKPKLKTNVSSNVDSLSCIGGQWLEKVRLGPK